MREHFDGVVERWNSLDESETRRLGLAMLGAATVAALSLAAYFTRGSGFALDEWNFMVGRQDWTWESFLAPANAHFVAVPALLSKLLYSTVGADSHTPFKVVTLGFQALIAWLLYLNAAQRVGPLVAVIPAVVILFLGSGWEVLINGAALDNQISLSAGLGMLLCLDRWDTRGDFGAAGLLLVAVSSHALGVAFAAGALVEIVLEKDTRRRIWVALGPIAVYSIWLVWAQKYGDTLISGYSVGSLPSGVFDQLAAAMGALTGLFRQPASLDVGAVISTVRIDRPAPLAFAFVALIVARVWMVPSRSPRFWAVLTVLAAYLVLVGVGLSDNRVPGASRYVFIASVLVLLLLAQMTEGLRLSRGWAFVAGGLAAVALGPNIAQIHSAGSFFQIESNNNRAELAALELARGTVDPNSLLEAGVTTFLPHRDIFFYPPAYFEAIDKFGSPAWTEQELLASDERYRELADGADAGLLGATFVAATKPSGGACRTVSPRPDGTFPELPVPPGRPLTFSPTGGATFQLTMRRFADADTVSWPAGSVPSVLTIPSDRSSRPWRVTILSTAPVEACGT